MLQLIALRGPIEDGLLSGNETLYWVFFSAVLFYAASYFARGYLAGFRRFGLFTGLICAVGFICAFAIEHLLKPNVAAATNSPKEG